MVPVNNLLAFCSRRGFTVAWMVSVFMLCFLQHGSLVGGTMPMLAWCRLGRETFRAETFIPS
jgi:hypothetical protein